MSETAEKVPQKGDPYNDRGRIRKIREVGRRYDDGGFEVLLNNGVWYDCYWNGEEWQYFPPAEAP